MADFLEIINDWFRAIGLGTDWTITWEVLFSFGTAVVSLLAFTIKHLFGASTSETIKTGFEYQQKEILAEQSAIYFNGEVVVFFKGLDKYGNSEVARSIVRFVGKGGKFTEKDFYVFLGWGSNSLSFQGHNDYEIHLASLERVSDSGKLPKATYTVIKIPKKIRFLKQLRSVAVAMSIGLLAHAILLARLGETAIVFGNQYPTFMVSGTIAFIVWLCIKIIEW